MLVLWDWAGTEKGGIPGRLTGSPPSLSVQCHPEGPGRARVRGSVRPGCQENADAEEAGTVPDTPNASQAVDLTPEAVDFDLTDRAPNEIDIRLGQRAVIVHQAESWEHGDYCRRASRRRPDRPLHHTTEALALGESSSSRRSCPFDGHLPLSTL